MTFYISNDAIAFLARTGLLFELLLEELLLERRIEETFLLVFTQV